MYETREKKPGILGGALSGYTAWKPVADTQTYKTELYYPGDADIVKFNDTYNWSGKELYGNKKGDHKLGETEYLDNSSLDIAGTTATKRYVICEQYYSGVSRYDGNCDRQYCQCFRSGIC